VGYVKLADDPAAANHLALFRIDSYRGVTETTILADPLVNGSTIIDYLPRLGQDVIYRLLAVAANGAYSYADAVVDTESHGTYALNFGEGFAELLRLQWDAQASRNRANDSEIFTFAGRPDPVQYSGEHVSKSINVSATILDEEDRPALEALGEWTRACTYRQPNGYRVHVNVNGISDGDPEEPGATPVSVDLTVVE
jgi:hypothetical protein